MSVCCSFVSNNPSGNGQDRCAGGIQTGFRSFTRSAVKLGPTHTWTHTFCARKSKHVGLGAVKSAASPSVSLSFLTESSHTWTHLSSRRLSSCLCLDSVGADLGKVRTVKIVEGKENEDLSSLSGLFYREHNVLSQSFQQNYCKLFLSSEWQLCVFIISDNTLNVKSNFHPWRSCNYFNPRWIVVRRRRRKKKDRAILIQTRFCWPVSVEIVPPQDLIIFVQCQSSAPMPDVLCLSCR